MGVIDPGYRGYEAIADTPAYEALNRRLVELADAPAWSPFVDLGCGTGALSHIMLERGHPARGSFAVDPDPGMVEIARGALDGAMTVREGEAGRLHEIVPPSSVGAVLLGNCVHLVGDIADAFADVRDVLAPGGVVAFSTAFHAGAAGAGDQPHYWRLVLTADRLLRHTERRRRAGRPLAKRELDEPAYRTLLEAAGLRVQAVDEVAVPLDRELVRGIVGNPAFASGALPGRDPVLAASALQRAVDEIFAGEPDLALERRWLFMTATRGERA